MLKTSLSVPFVEVAVVPQEGDNTAIAKRCIEKGTLLHDIPGDTQTKTSFQMKHTVLEGHRFALRVIESGDGLYSWGLPFGTATAKIEAGTYVLNQAMQAALTGRHITPVEAQLNNSADTTRNLIQEVLEEAEVNFVDLDVSPDFPFRIDADKLGVQGYNMEREQETETNGESTATFPGYLRATGAVGTRNHVVVIGLSALVTPFVRGAEGKYRAKKLKAGSSCDGVRVVVHTEGEADEQNNLTCLLRALCGFIIHPNVGAVVLVRTGEEAHLSLSLLKEFAASHEGYDPSCFDAPFLRECSLSSDEQVNGEEGSLTNSLQELDLKVEGAIQHAEATSRTPQPLSKLRIALQCGGSDSFSGMNGNPLAGAVAERMRQRFGTSSNLAESPELIGAENYILENVASEDVARTFIRTTENYKQYAADHGQSAAGNPSGGNLFRGLYNIVLKSLGAARKKPPLTTLDGVLEYGELMDPREDTIRQEVEGEVAPLPPSSKGAKGVYMFMDSPGNDLESIAGQVATGCNLIFFITGNGAMTNFPFVPTLKIVTTSNRFKALANEMDIDAGGFTNSTSDGNSGEERDALIEGVIQLVRSVSGGQLSKGEQAGHAQVSIWRNWSTMTATKGDSVGEPVSRTTPIPSASRADDVPAVTTAAPLSLSHATASTIKATPVPRLSLKPFVAAIVPTSICSSEIGRQMVQDFNAQNFLGFHWICPVHTEGCGAAGGKLWDQAYQRLLLNFITHQSVCHALFLEHGCEKTHNDYFKLVMEDAQRVAPELKAKFDKVGFVSIQKDGGIQTARSLVEDYFKKQVVAAPSAPPLSASKAGGPSIGLMIHTTARRQTALMVPEVAIAVSELIHHLVATFQGSVVLPSNLLLLQNSAFVAHCFQDPPTSFGDGATLRFAQRFLRTSSDEANCGVHIMAPLVLGNESASRMTWAEWVSGLGGVCDVVIAICEGKVAPLVTGSLLTPMLRVSWPSVKDSPSSSSAGHVEWAHWVQGTVRRCQQHLELRSNTSGGLENHTARDNWAEQIGLLNGDFTVPRGSAVSM